jgi:hypothetical protein
MHVGTISTRLSGKSRRSRSASAFNCDAALVHAAAQQIGGRCFDSRRRVNSTVGPLGLNQSIYETLTNGVKELQRWLLMRWWITAYLKREDFDTALEIAAEEIRIRLVMNDYPPVDDVGSVSF